MSDNTNPEQHDYCLWSPPFDVTTQIGDGKIGYVHLTAVGLKLYQPSNQLDAKIHNYIT